MPAAIRALAIALCALATLTLPPTLLARAVAGRVFSARLVKQELSDRLVDGGALRSAALRSVVPEEGAADDLLVALTANLEPAEWAEISQIAVPDGWVQSQMDAVVDSVFEWLAGDQLIPEVRLNIEPIRRNLIGSGTESITRIIVESWPECSLEQLFQLESTFRQTGQVPLLLCRPPEPIRSVAIGVVAEAFRSEARLLPATLDLAQAVQPEGAADLLQIKRALRYIRLAAGWAIAVPLILLGLVMALAVRSWRGWVRWWGIPLLIAGLLTVGLALVLFVLVAGRLSPDSLNSGASPILLRAVLAGLRDLLQRGLLRGAILGGLLAGIGGAALMVNWAWPEPASDVNRPADTVSDPEGETPFGMYG